MTWWQQAQHIYNECGYLVVARMTPMRVGEIVTDVVLAGGELVNLPQPFRVVSKTGLEEYRAQCLAAGCGPLAFNPDHRFFYRIMTD